jgi:hypothetical protein
MQIQYFAFLLFPASLARFHCSFRKLAIERRGAKELSEVTSTPLFSFFGWMEIIIVNIISYTTTTAVIRAFCVLNRLPALRHRHRTGIKRRNGKFSMSAPNESGS